MGALVGRGWLEHQQAARCEVATNLHPDLVSQETGAAARVSPPLRREVVPGRQDTALAKHRSQPTTLRDELAATQPRVPSWKGKLTPYSRRRRGKCLKKWALPKSQQWVSSEREERPETKEKEEETYIGCGEVEEGKKSPSRATGAGFK